MGPISSMMAMPEWLDMLIALLIGIGFGFSLEQAGFSSSRKLVGMFYGYDTTVIKVFFTAAIVALVGSQFLSFFGLLNLNQVFVNEFYVYASIVGGICPGTGLSALSIGKIDALFYVLGGLAGAFLFAETYPRIQNLANGSYKGAVKIDDALGIPAGVFILLLIAAAVVMFWIGELAEKRFARADITDEI
jgi:hypothetical protein